MDSLYSANTRQEPGLQDPHRPEPLSQGTAARCGRLGRGFPALDRTSMFQAVSFALSNVLDARSLFIQCARTSVTRPATTRPAPSALQDGCFNAVNPLGRRPGDCRAPCKVAVATSRRDSGHSCPGNHKCHGFSGFPNAAPRVKQNGREGRKTSMDVLPFCVLFREKSIQADS